MAFHPKETVYFRTLGLSDWINGTESSLPVEESRAWRAQMGRQAALWEASRRSGVAFAPEQRHVVQ